MQFFARIPRRDVRLACNRHPGIVWQDGVGDFHKFKFASVNSAEPMAKWAAQGSNL